MIRYPAERLKYCKAVGQLRVNNLARILRNLGFKVSTSEHPEHHHADMWVWKERITEIALIIEVLNWKRQTYLDAKRLERIIANLDNTYYPNARKLLVYSFNRNIKIARDYLELEDIDLIEIGFQTQPLRYFTWFLQRNRVKKEGRRPNTRATRRIVRRKLTNYLREKNLI